MKALRVTSIEPELVLSEHQLPQPVPGPGEVVVRVRAAGVSPTEPLWYPTTHTVNGGARTGAVLAHEFSGEVIAVGDGVTDVAVGEDVYGMNDWYAEGALAEYCVTRPEWIAPKPPALSHEEAASVPLSALTAKQGLFVYGRLRPGDRVLVHGGAGAVGIFAVQLAHIHGAHVITTVSARDVAFAKQLGAAEAIDYRNTPFEATVAGIDVVFDTVGHDTLQRSWQVLNPGGRMVTVAVDSKSATDERVRQAFFIVEPNGRDLREIGSLLESGQLRTYMNAVPPRCAAKAYAGTLAKSGPGRQVVSISNWI